MSDNNLWLRASLQNINEGLKDQDPKLIKAFAETLSPEAITGLLKTSNALTDFLAAQQGATRKHSASSEQNKKAPLLQRANTTGTKQ